MGAEVQNYGRESARSTEWGGEGGKQREENRKRERKKILGNSEKMEQKLEKGQSKKGGLENEVRS